MMKAKQGNKPKQHEALEPPWPSWSSALAFIMLQGRHFELRPGGIDDVGSEGRVIVRISLEVNESPGV